jgi:hypothetical protein
MASLPPHQLEEDTKNLKQERETLPPVRRLKSVVPPRHERPSETGGPAMVPTEGTKTLAI